MSATTADARPDGPRSRRKSPRPRSPAGRRGAPVGCRNAHLHVIGADGGTIPRRLRASVMAIQNAVHEMAAHDVDGFAAESTRQEAGEQGGRVKLRDVPPEQWPAGLALAVQGGVGLPASRLHPFPQFVADDTKLGPLERLPVVLRNVTARPGSSAWLPCLLRAGPRPSGQGISGYAASAEWRPRATSRLEAPRSRAVPRHDENTPAKIQKVRGDSLAVRNCFVMARRFCYFAPYTGSLAHVLHSWAHDLTAWIPKAPHRASVARRGPRQRHGGALPLR